MATPTEFFNATLPEEIPIPDWTHLHIPQLPTLKLRWDEIHIDDALNTSKVEAHTPAEIQRIKLSFAEKVDIKEYPPAVRYRGGDREPWELVYGFGREEALRELDTEGWFFTHLEGSDDAIGDVQAQENEKLPKRVNEEIDFVRCLTLKVLKGHIERKEDAVREKFKLIYPNRSKEVRNRVVKKVLAALGVESPFKIYTSTTHIKNWIKNNSSEEYVIDNTYDDDRKLYCVTMKEGYQYRTVLGAYKTFQETGHKTGVIFHCGSPTKKATLEQKRQQVIDGFNAIRKTLEHSGCKVWPIEILGALPQDTKKESMKRLIKFY